MSDEKWFDTLSSQIKERVFSTMRKMGDESLEMWRRSRDLSPRSGEIAIGAGDMDYVFKATSLDSFLSSLRNGHSPQGAMEKAKEEAEKSVRKWNEFGYKSRVSFGGSETLKRDQKCMDSYILGLYLRVNNIVEREGVNEHL